MTDIVSISDCVVPISNRPVASISDCVVPISTSAAVADIDKMKKISKVAILLIIILMYTSCSPRQRYTPENQFDVSPIKGGVAVIINKYNGSEWNVNIPP